MSEATSTATNQQCEAEKAIYEMNGKPPFNFIVNWASHKKERAEDTNGKVENMKTPFTKTNAQKKQTKWESSIANGSVISSTSASNSIQQNTSDLELYDQSIDANLIKIFCEKLKSTDTCLCRRSRNLNMEFLENCKEQIIFKIKINKCKLCLKSWSSISLYNFSHIDYTCECVYEKANLSANDSLTKDISAYRFGAQYWIKGKKMTVNVKQYLSENKLLCLSINENTIESYNLLCTDFIVDCQKHSEAVIFTSRDIDTFVAVDLEDGSGWFRGMKMSNDKFALIDEGRILSKSDIKAIIPIPEKYSSIPAFCCAMELMTPALKIQPCELECYVMYNDSSDSVFISFEKNHTKYYAVLKYWNPLDVLDNAEPDEKICEMSTEIQSNIFPGSSIHLESGNIVIMTHYCHGKEVYLRLGDKKSKKEYNSLLNTLAIEAQDASQLQKPLSPRDAAFHYIEDDDEYQRVLVMSVNVDETYNVICLDTGIASNVPSSNLKEITENAKKLPMKVKKVSLADISGDLPTQGTMKYVEKLIERESPLICTIEPSGEITLKIEYSGENLNAKILRLMTPIFDQLRMKNINIFDLPILLDHEIKPLSFEKLKESGKPFKLLVLDTSHIEQKMISCTQTDEILQRKFNILKKEINQYCIQQKQHYLPRPRELCLALFTDGQYYRACVHKVDGDEVTVTFLDYGNITTLNRTSIRRMLPYFIEEVPQLATPFILTGFPENCSKNVLHRAGKILIDYPITITSMKKMNNTYSIYVPSLINQLHEEGLI